MKSTVMKSINPAIITKKASIGFVFIVFIFILIGIVTWLEIHSLSQFTSKIYRHPLTVSNAALRASMSVVKMHRSMKDVVLADEQLPIEDAINHVNAEEKIVYQNLDIVKERILGTEGQILIQKTIELFADWQPIREEVINLARNGDRVKAASITKGKGAQHELLLENKMLELTAYARKKADGFIEESIEIHERATYFTTIMVITGVLLSTLIAFLTTRQILSALLKQKEAEKALKVSSEKIKLFAYSVAHDLKNPALALQGLTKVLSKNHSGSLSNKGRHLCDQIQRSAERIVTLVDTINVFISTKETPLVIENISLKEVLQIIREEFSSQMNIRSVKLAVSEKFPDTIRADRISILRLLRNLIDNAFKYAGNTLSKIEIGYKEADNFHILSVKDDGQGIKSQDFNKIFGLFQRQTTSREVHGTGLGLAIVKEIAELHKGEVWVEPNPDGGVTFYVSISMHLK